MSPVQAGQSSAKPCPLSGTFYTMKLTRSLQLLTFDQLARSLAVLCLDGLEFINGVLIRLMVAFQHHEPTHTYLGYQPNPVRQDVAGQVCIARLALEVHVVFEESQLGCGLCRKVMTGVDLATMRPGHLYIAPRGLCLTELKYLFR